MRDYLTLVTRYLSAHKKKVILTVVSVAISVSLITGTFSMLDVFLRFEKLQVIHDKGNFHLVFIDTSENERKVIGSRIDVENAGQWKRIGEGRINGIKCELAALDENIAPNFNVEIREGQYPTKKNEIMLEQWAMERLRPGLRIHDSVEIAFADGSKREYVISGIYNDLGNMKAKGIPGVLLAINGSDEVSLEKPDLYAVLFKSGVKISLAENEIKKDLNIADDRVGRNEHLLTIIGQSNNKGHGLYAVGAILFCLVLIAGVVMIYNTFNISVMERVRHFGLLRCIGASRDQIKKLVKREGVYITVRAIPIGVLAGLLMTFICSAILKFYNKTLFGEIPLFTLSLSGIGAGIVIGFLTVFIATLLPAKRAAQISPVNAVTGSNEYKTSKNKKKGYLTKLFPVEIAMGINNATMKKKTLLLMSSSIAICIIMFLGFQVFVSFMHTSMKTTKPYTPDITLVSEQGLNEDLYTKLKSLDGVKKVYGRMVTYVDATFAANRLTDEYKAKVDGITVKNNGLFVPPEESWLISYDKSQLYWAKEDLLQGTLDEEKLNEQNGIIVVLKTLRKGVQYETTNLQLGDKVYVDTPSGTKELKVMGILRTVPLSDTKLTLTTFITTEKLFTELAGPSVYKTIDIQLKRMNQERSIGTIRGVLNDTITFLDQRQNNAEMNQTFITMAVFIYGFVAVIALISILNIINTMNTSVAAKIRYMGVMRAIGMSGDQLDKMVLVEAATYSLTGYIAGCILGIILQKYLIFKLLAHYHIIWVFPLVQLILILIFTMFMTVISIISPLKRIKACGISEVVNSL